MSRASFRTVTAMAAGLTLVSAGALVAGSTPASATANRSAIVSAAVGQLGDNGCSPNSYYGSCSQEWCADFSRWAWAQGGVDVSSLGASVTTFVNYGVNNGTWHDPGTYTPQPGDAMIFGGQGFPTKASGGAHVGLVEKVNSDGTITEIGGNQSGQVTEVTGSADSIESQLEGSGYSFLGYVSPVGAGNSSSPTGGTRGASAVVSQPGGIVEMFFRGSDNNIWHDWYTPGIGWRGAEQLTFTGNVTSDPSAVNSATGTWDVFYKGSDGNLWHVFTNAGGSGWTTGSLGDGPLGGNPEAVAQTDGTVEVFWRGQDNNVWHGWYMNGMGWRGPEQLTSTGNVVGDVAPANGATGTWDIFWKGTDANLWHVFTNSGGGGWTTGNRGSGPLGGTPKAIGRSDGQIETYWRGGDNNLWHTWYTPGGLGWRGPERLSGNANMASDPAPVNSATNTWDNFYEGSDGNLWHVFTNGGSWTTESLGYGILGGGPMATGQTNGTIDVFWHANSNPGGPWHASYTGQWSPAGAMGGTMY